MFIQVHYLFAKYWRFAFAWIISNGFDLNDSALIMPVNSFIFMQSMQNDYVFCLISKSNSRL